MTFLSTTLPGAAAHCLMDYDWRANQPKSPLSLIPNPGWPAKNCGDLIFSGHMLATTVSLCTIYKYAKPMFALSDCGYRALMALAVMLALTQAALIISTRNHYTVDVVVASYLVPLLWHAVETLGPADMAVDNQAVAHRLLGRHKGELPLRRWCSSLAGRKVLVPCGACLLFWGGLVAWFARYSKMNIDDLTFGTHAEKQAQLAHMFKTLYEGSRPHGIQPILAYGSLLGAVRDHAMIKDDYDGDVWVDDRDYTRLLEVLPVMFPPSEYHIMDRAWRSFHMFHTGCIIHTKSNLQVQRASPAAPWRAVAPWRAAVLCRRAEGPRGFCHSPLLSRHGR